MEGRGKWMFVKNAILPFCLSSNVGVHCAASHEPGKVRPWSGLGLNPGAHVGVASSRSTSDHAGTQRAL